MNYTLSTDENTRAKARRLARWQRLTISLLLVVAGICIGIGIVLATQPPPEPERAGVGALPLTVYLELDDVMHIAETSVVVPEGIRPLPRPY